MNNQKLFSYTFIMIGISLIGNIKGVSAEEAMYRPNPSESLEVSLLSLKQSAQQLAMKNQWLLHEVERYQEQIVSLQNSWQGGTKQQRLPKYQIKVQQSHHIDLERNLSLKTNSRQQLLQEADQLQRDIQQLENVLTHSAVPSQQGNHKNTLKQVKSEIKINRQEVSRLKKQLRSINRKAGKPLRRFLSIDEKNELLEQKLVLLDSQMQALLLEEKQLKNEISALERNQTSEITDIQESLANLKAKEEAMAKILGRANTKMTRQKIDFHISDDEIEVLMENVSMLEVENNSLKSRVSMLSDNLAGLK